MRTQQAAFANRRTHIDEQNTAKELHPFAKARAKALLPLLALAIFGTLFARHIAALDGAAIRAALTELTLWQWAAAGVLTALSFRAIGSYDVLVHRVLGTGQPAKVARNAGIKAIALSQTLGFGILTSALVRWRCLPDLSAATSLRLSTVVSVSFMAALAVVTALVVPFSGLVPKTGTLIIGGIAAAAALCVLPWLAHRLNWIVARVRTETLVALLLATAADTALAAAALWVLWPDPIAFSVLFAAYLVALGAGLMSNSPGGMGAFDLTLLALLPLSNDAQAMASLLAFRIIYYAIPAALALMALIKPAGSRLVLDQDVDHPEAALALQSANIHHHGAAPLLTLPTWGAGAVLGDLPENLSVQDLRRSNGPKAFYKCSATQAAKARADGWAVLRCAQDANLDLDDWSLNGAPRRQLRRALKQFENSGLIIREVRNMTALSCVAQAWATQHGGERGHSMGRYCPDYLERQRVFAAYDGTRAVAFVSFHIGDVWTLDLMRHDADLARGTMHALVHAGIKAAQTSGARNLSLAAVPAPCPSLPGAERVLNSAQGLIRFKSSFGPTWRPLFLCATSWPRLYMNMAALAYAIHRPGPLTKVTNSAHRDDEDFSFAQCSPACEPQP